MHKSKIKVHFIGIGGIGMSGIAEILNSMGFFVSGSDVQSSDVLKKLIEKGINISIGHNLEHVSTASVVVYSSAVGKENVELKYARENNIPTMRRAEMLAELMRLKKGVAIAGTHGKTTTTSLLATILHEGGYDPTYIIGGIVKNLGGNAKVGSGEYLIAEADESDGTFLLLNPIISAITNIDKDHLDYYEDYGHLERSFIEFSNKVPFYGCTVLNGNDKHYESLVQNIKKPYVTFGINKNNNDFDYSATDIIQEKLTTSFKFFWKDQFQANITVSMLGEHNISNILCAFALAHQMGLDFATIIKSLEKFEGVARRLQLIYESKTMRVLEDYAHHPTEILATISAVKKSIGDEKLYVVFQPHRYSRTKACWDEYLHCFNMADEVYLLPIYPASEEKVAGIESDALSRDINKLHPMLSDFLLEGSTADTVKKLVAQEGVLLVMGAGDVGKKVRDILQGYKALI